MKAINKIWKGVVKTGVCTLPKLYGGVSFPYEVQPEFKKHLKLAAEYDLHYDYLCRYNRSNVVVQVEKYCAHHGFSTDSDFCHYLKVQKAELKKREHHLTDNILENAYMVFKPKTGLSEFASIAHDKYASKVVDRLSSHPGVCPSWEDRPNTAVKRKGDYIDDELERRCHDMWKMTLLEQSAQVFYLRCWYDLSDSLSVRTEEDG